MMVLKGCASGKEKNHPKKDSTCENNGEERKWQTTRSKTYFFLIYLIYLFLAALGLRCCVQPFSSCGELGLLFVAVCRLLIAVASLVVEHGL